MLKKIFGQNGVLSNAIDLATLPAELEEARKQKTDFEKMLSNRSTLIRVLQEKREELNCLEGMIRNCPRIEEYQNRRTSLLDEIANLQKNNPDLEASDEAIEAKRRDLDAQVQLLEEKMARKKGQLKGHFSKS
jgi:chromosome segregation ATPase